MGLGALAAMGAALGVVVAAVSSPDAAVRAVGELLPGLDALTWGDTHLLTFDGLLVDFQAVGEFVLIRSNEGDLEVQVRQRPHRDSGTVSVNTAVAANVAGNHVSIDGAQAEPLRIDGEPSTVTEEGVGLSNGGQVAFDGVFYTLTWPDGSEITVPVWNYDPKWLEVRVSLADARAGTIEGLLGDSDGDPANDLTAADGTVLGTEDVSFDDLYRTWGDSWRVTPADSLFDYGTGESTESFTDIDFPDEAVTVDSLSEEARQAATRTCREAGVTQAAILEACILDVAVTGNAEFANAAADLQAAWLGGAAGGAGEAQLEITGTTEDSIDLAFDPDESSNPPDGSFMVLAWRNDGGQRMTIGTGRFTGTRHGVQVQLQLFANRAGYSHDAFGDQCDVTFTTADASRIEGSISCTFDDVTVEGSFNGEF
jgi:hypothetical protein